MPQSTLARLNFLVRTVYCIKTNILVQKGRNFCRVNLFLLPANIQSQRGPVEQQWPVAVEVWWEFPQGFVEKLRIRYMVLSDQDVGEA